MTDATWHCAVPEPDALGESPFWHPDEQALYWVDVPGRRLRRWQPAAGTPAEAWGMPSEPGCIAPARRGGLVVALRDGIYRAPAWGGPLLLLARFGHDSATTRFNDGKADPLGRLWAGTIYEPRDARAAELFSIDGRPEVARGAEPLIERKAGNATTANGLAFAPDRRTVYWADTPTHAIQAWDWDADSNALSRHRVVHQFAPKPAGWQPGDAGYGGRPDGAAIDAEGNYWVALFEGGRLAKLSPTGALLAELPVPVRCPTMPCFGGADLRTLYVTSARRGRPEAELASHPWSGCIIATQVDVPGLPVNFFID